MRYISVIKSLNSNNTLTIVKQDLHQLYVSAGRAKVGKSDLYAPTSDTCTIKYHSMTLEIVCIKDEDIYRVSGHVAGWKQTLADVNCLLPDAMAAQLILSCFSALETMFDDCNL